MLFPKAGFQAPPEEDEVALYVVGEEAAGEEAAWEQGPMEEAAAEVGGGQVGGSEPRVMAMMQQHQSSRLAGLERMDWGKVLGSE